MNVGHLIKGLGRGGAEMLLPHLTRATPQHSTHVAYFLPHKDALAAELAAAGAQVTCLGAATNLSILASSGSVRRWIRANRLDLVHAHLPISGAIGRLAARREQCPLVYTEHNLQERYRPLTRLINRVTWKAQDRAVAVSEEVAKSIERHLGNFVPVRVVANGIPELGTVDPGRVKQLRESVGIGEAPTVGTVAVFRVQKRIDEWLRVARRVAEANPAARFVLVGDGPLRSDIEGWIQEAGLSDVVILPGLQENVGEWLACMDVFLTTSVFEGLPLALLEAMVSRTPVVATAVGGVAEVVRHGDNGYLLPFGSTSEQAAFVVELLDHRDLRDALGRAGRNTVVERFGIGRMAAELAGVYEEILQEQTR